MHICQFLLDVADIRLPSSDFYLLIVDNRVELAPGVDYVRTADVKDQIELSGIDIAAVSMTGTNSFMSHFNLTCAFPEPVCSSRALVSAT